MDERLIYFTSVLALGISAQWLAWKLKLPSILLLLAFGFGAGLIYDQSQIIEVETLFALVSLSVAIILLEGGLTLRFSELKEAGPAVFRLVGPGSMVSWGLSSVAAHYLAGFSWPVAVLVAALVVVTGPTVIGPILKTIKPRRSVNSILKWEGIVIDPVGAILAVLVFGVFFGHGHGQMGWAGVALGIGKTLLVGVGLGYLAAWALSFALSKHWVPDFLQSVVVLTVGLALFTVSNLIQHESGLLTVTIIGIGLANQHRAKIRHVVEFKEVLRTVLISCLFIVLGGRIGVDDFMLVWKEALLFLVALIVVIRPASVFISTLGLKNVTFKEKVFLSMMAPRGIVAAAVSSVFALDLAAQHTEYAAEAARIVPVVYAVIVGTVAFYGLLAGFVSRRLGLATKNPQGVLFIGIKKWSIEAAAVIQEAGFRVLMMDTNYAATAEARMAGVPAVNANVLSDFAAEELDLVGIGSMVAATGNDQVNTLACVSLGHTLGISHVFQIKPEDVEESERKSSSTEYNGRLIGNRSLTAAEFDKREKSGAVVKRTTLNEAFTLASFEEVYGESATILFRITSSGGLKVVTPESTPPSVGDQLISLVVEPDSENDPVPVNSPALEGPVNLP
ncbi:MAG: sodium:proton antiporter [Verrucomicrobiales bacterium]|nr:sodium:proton antiporter [Verrucomicrobiales bacterium]